jgi:hypothetical protein
LSADKRSEVGSRNGWLKSMLNQRKYEAKNQSQMNKTEKERKKKKKKENQKKKDTV